MLNCRNCFGTKAVVGAPKGRYVICADERGVSRSNAGKRGPHRWPEGRWFVAWTDQGVAFERQTGSKRHCWQAKYYPARRLVDWLRSAKTAHGVVKCSN